MLLFDIETDGLLDAVTKIHCLVIKNTDTGDLYRCYDDPDNPDCMDIKSGLEYLESVGNEVGLGGHNIIKYDIPVIQKLYPWFTVDKAKVFDTLVASRLIWSNIKDQDTILLKRKQLPGNLFGAHKLEAWGYRLKLMKGEYAEEFKARMGEDYEEGMEWREFSQEMLDYCVQDVAVTAALMARILDKNYSAEALELEHSVAWLMAKQERNGFCFDVPKAASLYSKLAQRRGELERELREFFRFWFAPAGRVVTKGTRKVFHEDPRGGTKRRIKEKGKDPYFQTGWYEYFEEGVEYTKVKLVEFNPSSRDHIADRLKNLYGWEPELFTDGGKPKVDEDVMKGLDYPPCKLLTEYLTVSKRISQLAEGDQAWLKVERNGKIHGSVNPNGAVTGRATHAFPNVAQVPKVQKDKTGILMWDKGGYGYECRDLFTVPQGWVLMGADASGLELRCLAHFMGKFDGGKYGKVLLEGDIHSENQKAAGLPSRDNAKTFIYAFLYGAGDAKIGKIVGLDSAAGKSLKASFLKKTPALKKLIDAVKNGIRDRARTEKRRYILGLDRRHVHVRSDHAALNTLLQSAGALLCKKWLVLLEQELQAAGLKHGWDGDYAFCAWVHDEVQIACRTQAIAEFVAKTAEACVTKAGEHFNLRCPLAGESKLGKTWAETH